MRKNITEWEVLTPSGWSDFSGVHSVQSDGYYRLVFDNGSELICSRTHRILLESNEFEYANMMQIGQTVFGGLTLVDSVWINDECELYDLLDVEHDYQYITNDVVSHNCAFIDRAESIWTSAFQTLATGGKAILLSTPNGVGNFFHSQWEKADTGESSFNPIILPWDVHPERDRAWFDKQCTLADRRQIAQELECNFNASGDTVIDPEILEWYEKNMQCDPPDTRGSNAEMFIYEPPISDRTYMVVADIARGDGTDFSTFHVLDIDDLRQVAEYKSLVDTKTFGNLLVAVATEYNDALLVIENANVGWAVIQQVLDREYKNLFYSIKDEGYIDQYKHLSRGYDLRDKSKMVPGFTTSGLTRPLMIDKLETYFREKVLKVYSKRTLKELRVFVWKNNKAQAMSGYNDDLVMALAIGCYVRDTAIRLRELGLTMTRAALGATQRVDTIYRSDMNQKSYGWKVKTGKTEEDISWLVKKKQQE